MTNPLRIGVQLPEVEYQARWPEYVAMARAAEESYGNSVEGFAELNARISAAAEKAGRDPAGVKRSAAVLVELDSEAVRRPHTDEEVEPVIPDELPAFLRDLAEAGADEAILILRPITEASIRAVLR